MAKYIGVKMIDAIPMLASEARKHGYKVNENASDYDRGYEVIYPGGYKSWSPAESFEAAYFRLNNAKGDKIDIEDVNMFIAEENVTTIGTKNTVVTLTALTGFETTGNYSCVKVENYDANIGYMYARPKAKDAIWAGLDFVLQWAINGLKRE